MQIKFFTSLEFDFFRVQLKFAFRILAVIVKKLTRIVLTYY